MENQVVSFLKEHPRVIFSPKSLSRHTGIQKKYILKMSYNHPNIRRAEAREVGSGRHNLTLLTFKHEE